MQEIDRKTGIVTLSGVGQVDNNQAMKTASNTMLGVAVIGVAGTVVIGYLIYKALSNNKSNKRRKRK